MLFKKRFVEYLKRPLMMSQIDESSDCNFNILRFIKCYNFKSHFITVAYCPQSNNLHLKCS